MQEGANTLRSLTLFVSSHFMFNVLGKLQSEILSGEKREAISTLSLYSLLLRKSCEFSQKKLISLKEEGDFLNAYLSLEKERFGEDLVGYKLQGFDSDEIFIEAFLLQPFVELAILSTLQKEKTEVVVEYKPDLHQVHIHSAIINTEIREKLAGKLETALERIKLFEHSYQLDETEKKSLQVILLKK